MNQAKHLYLVPCFAVTCSCHPWLMISISFCICGSQYTCCPSPKSIWPGRSISWFWGLAAIVGLMNSIAVRRRSENTNSLDMPLRASISMLLQRSRPGTTHSGCVTCNRLYRHPPIDHDVCKGHHRMVACLQRVILCHRRGPDNSTSYSYSEILLQPAAAALNAVITNETVVEMALGGEQGRSVFGYPQAYMDMIQQARLLIPRAKKVMTGVSFNYDKVCVGW